MIAEAITKLEKGEENRLIKEAESYARTVSEFLKEREEDLKELSRLPRTEASFLRFYQMKKGKVWHAIMTKKGFVEKKEYLPLYKEIAFIDDKGEEKIVIKNGKPLLINELRNVSNPKNTTYLKEDYFEKAKALKAGETYLSSLKGFAMTKKEQIGDALKPEDVKGGKPYDGVLRFSMPLFEKKAFIGVLTIALDHIHLQELTIHLDPRYGNSTLYTSYDSGNYAFIFDDTGWIITHPKLWDLPGVYRDGREKRYMTEKSNKEDIEEGVEGFNLDYAGFISPLYPFVAKEVREKKKGIVTVTNVGGIRKVMAYAPIRCDIKPYDKSGVFGGFTLGERLEEFSESSRDSQRILLEILNNYQKTVGAVFLFIVFFVSFAGILFSRHITAPIIMLSKKTQFLGETDFEHWEKIDRNDEIGDLAKLFYEMNNKIKEQTKHLKASMKEVKEAKKQLEEYNKYLKKEIDLLKDEKFRQVDRLSAIGKLAAGLAHEIRNPLTGITLFLDDLHDRLCDDPDSQKLIVDALKEIERVDRLINELLYFSSSRPTERSYFNVSLLIDSVIVFINKLCQKSNINVELDVDKDLSIYGNKERIKQAVLNVVLNAIQAMEKGGTLTIIVKKEEKIDKENAIIMVKDTGTGIDEKELERIFEPFYTLRKEGTGLGLAIAFSIVAEHKGTIVAKNWEKGAMFIITLPLSKKDE